MFNQSGLTMGGSSPPGPMDTSGYLPPFLLGTPATKSVCLYIWHTLDNVLGVRNGPITQYDMDTTLGTLCTYQCVAPPSPWDTRGNLIIIDLTFWPHIEGFDLALHIALRSKTRVLMYNYNYVQLLEA